MKISLAANLDCIYSNISYAVFGHLLINREVSSISFNQLHIPKNDKKQLYKYTNHFNKISDKFVLEDSNIQLHKSLSIEIEKHLLNQLIKIVTPQNFDKDNFCTAFFKRYITHESYEQSTLQLFNKYVNRLCNINVKLPSFSELYIIRNFTRILISNQIALRNIISDMINGDIKCHDNVANYFNNIKVASANIDLINSYKIFPEIIKNCDKKLILTSTFFKDNFTILPY